MGTHRRSEGRPITSKLSLALYWLTATSVLLCFLLYFLAENGRINAFATYLLAISVIASLFLGETRQRIGLLHPALPFAVLLLLAYLAISATWSVQGDVIQYLGYAALITAFVTGFYLACRTQTRFLPFLLNVIVGCAVISASLSVYLHFAYPDYQPLPEPRLYGVGRLSNPVISATSYGFAAIIACHVFIGQRSMPVRLLLAVSVVLFMTAIVLSGSRTVWLALAVSLGAMLAQQRNHNSWLGFVAAFFIVGVVMVLALGYEELTRRALSFRPEIWTEFVARTFEANVLVGVGSGSDSYWQMPELLIQHPHSVFVSTFYFGGVIGLSLIIAVIVLCFREVLSAPASRTRELAIVTGLFGMTVGFFDGDNVLTKIDFHWWLSWFPITICLLLSAETRERASA